MNQPVSERDLRICTGQQRPLAGGAAVANQLPATLQGAFNGGGAWRRQDMAPAGAPGEAATRALGEADIPLLISPAGVLYDDTIWLRWLLQLVSRLGLHTHKQAFIEMWRRDYYQDVCFGRRPYWEAMRSFLLSAGLAKGQIDEVCAAGRPRLRQVRESMRAFPGVVVALQGLLQAGARLGLVVCSPLAAKCIKQQLERMHIGVYFDFVVSSSDAGPAACFSDLLDASLVQWTAPAGCRQAMLISSSGEEAAVGRGHQMRTVGVDLPSAPGCDVQIERLHQAVALMPASPLDHGRPRAVAG